MYAQRIENGDKFLQDEARLSDSIYHAAVLFHLLNQTRFLCSSCVGDDHLDGAATSTRKEYLCTI